MSVAKLEIAGKLILYKNTTNIQCQSTKCFFVHNIFHKVLTKLRKHFFFNHFRFVTLENAPKEVLVGLLFSLHDKRLSNGEPIKARLKTESNVKSFYTAVPNGIREVEEVTPPWTKQNHQGQT